MIDDFRPPRRPTKSVPVTTQTQPIETATPTDSFRTPEEVAAREERAATTPDRPAAGDKSGWRSKLTLKHFGHQEWLVSAAIILVCGSIVGFILTRVGDKPVASATQTVKPAPKKIAPQPTTVASTLTGLPVEPAVNQRPVTGVMIENSLDARPQSGLADAGVVFEAIAEGGITRFLALYQDTAPDNVGPIRSARPYYVQWAMGFDAGYAHVGGSPEALADIKAWGARDLDQFANSGSYHRTASRAAPHNVYTSIASLNQLEVSKGYTTSTYSGFVRKKAAPSQQVTAKSINIKISGPLYNVHYDYNAATNSYARSEGSAAHIDANGNRQIVPTVVIALAIPYSLAPDHYHSQYQAIGSGPAYIFQDGTMTTAQWSKVSEKEQLKLTDVAGQPLPLNPGQTWITAVSSLGNVSATP